MHSNSSHQAIGTEVTQTTASGCYRLGLSFKSSNPERKQLNEVGLAGRSERDARGQAVERIKVVRFNRSLTFTKES